MRRITLAVVTTLAVLVLLFSYRTSRDRSVTASTVAVAAAHVVSARSATTVSSAAGPDPSTPDPTDQITTASKRRIPTTARASKTSTKAVVAPTSTGSPTVKVDGAAVSTPYGDVQVEVTITGGRITDVQALQYPDQQSLDQQINGDALPQLQAQVLSAQSANIAGVSGATFTSQGYIGSLQSALDTAKFK